MKITTVPNCISEFNHLLRPPTKSCAETRASAWFTLWGILISTTLVVDFDKKFWTTFGLQNHTSFYIMYRFEWWKIFFREMTGFKCDGGKCIILNHSRIKSKLFADGGHFVKLKQSFTNFGHLLVICSVKFLNVQWVFTNSRNILNTLSNINNKISAQVKLAISWLWSVNRDAYGTGTRYWKNHFLFAKSRAVSTIVEALVFELDVHLLETRYQPK